jgi:hypothetical protein
VEYQRIAAAGFFFLPSTDSGVPFGGPVSWNGAGMGAGGFVFGTLLGPEATGPCMRVGRFLERGGGVPVWAGLFVSGFLAAPITRFGSCFVAGVCVGCVVWGCCLRTT